MPALRESLVLGLESSCDETAAAVVARTPDGRGRILSNVVRAQWEEHRPFGGVVPEIAARAHLDCLDDITAAALGQAGVGLDDLAGIAVTAGPGLIGGLIVGMEMAKALALVTGKPLIAVNHLEGHALTVGLTDAIPPPYALLLVSGGHTQVLHVAGVGRYRRIASTIDDALGEAFDKTAKLMGLGAPGGPAVEQAALAGDATRFDLPRPMLGRTEPHFSFAGLKTAVRQRWAALDRPTSQDAADLCASFEAAVAACVIDRVRRALALMDESVGRDACATLVVAGGVAANKRLRAALQGLCDADHRRLVVPPPALCTDNGAMIAWAGAERLALGLVDGLDAAARARWPLDAEATAVLGSGRLGGKA